MKDIKMVYSTEFCKTVVQFSNEENYKNKREHYVELAKAENSIKIYVEYYDNNNEYHKEIILKKEENK